MQRKNRSPPARSQFPHRSHLQSYSRRQAVPGAPADDPCSLTRAGSSSSPTRAGPGRRISPPSKPMPRNWNSCSGNRSRYVDSIFGKHAREAVHAMKAGEILMLENVRFNAEENLTLKPEEAKKTHLVRKLSSMADFSSTMRSGLPTAPSPPSSVSRSRCVRRRASSWRRKSQPSRRSSPGPPPGLHGAWRDKSR